MNKYLLVISHPDDESMFFLPTICSILNNHQNNNDVLDILCLSNGNYDGLGKQREKELIQAIRCLKKKYTSNKSTTTTTTIGLHILNLEKLQDGPKNHWDHNLLSQVIFKHVETKMTDPKKDTNESPNNNLIIITFDQYGISNHPNHIDTHYGVRTFIQQQQQQQLQNNTSICAWELVTVPTLPFIKYVPIFVLIHMLILFIFNNGMKQKVNLCINKGGGNQSFYLFQPTLVWNAMASHHTQFVWYRRLSVLFSVYTYHNTLRPISKK